MLSFMRPSRRRNLHLIISALALSLIVVSALFVPRVMHTAHAAAPKPATTCVQPPAGKDPATFTRQQLQTYGLPLRLPGQSQAQWANLVRHARARMCNVQPRTRMTGGSASAPISTTTSAKGLAAVIPPSAAWWHATPSCTQCYAGISADSSLTDKPDNLAVAYGEWTVPCLTNLAPRSAYTQWVGIGYPWDGPNERAGVITQVISITAFGRTISYPVYTAFVASAGQESTFGISCGDDMTAQVFPDTPGSIGQVNLFDNTTGNYTSLLPDPTVNPAHAECFVEDPYGGSEDLANFGTTTFDECEGVDQTAPQGAPLWNWPYGFPNIMGNSGALTSIPSLFDDGGFTVQWIGPH